MFLGMDGEVSWTCQVTRVMLIGINPESNTEITGERGEICEKNAWIFKSRLLEYRVDF